MNNNNESEFTGKKKDNKKYNKSSLSYNESINEPILKQWIEFGFHIVYSNRIFLLM